MSLKAAQTAEAALRKQTEDVQAQSAQQSTALQTAKDQLDALQAQLDASQQEQEASQAQLHSAQGQLEASQAELHAAQMEQEASQAQLQGLQAAGEVGSEAAMEGLQQQIDDQQRELRSLEEQLTNALQDGLACSQQADEVRG